MLQRRESPACGRETVAAIGKDLEILFPRIAEHLTQGVWPDGKVRRTSSLAIFAEAGVIKLCLSDRSADMIAFVSGKDLTEAAMSLEGQLEGGTLEWRPCGKGKGK